MRLKLNCDLAETSSESPATAEQAVMPHLDQANIACAFHAGDPLRMQQTITLAKRHQVSIGAHPAYADRKHFGRRSLHWNADLLTSCLHYQIGALDTLCKLQATSVDYVKPHGALYHDMMQNTAVREVVMRAIADYPRPLTLMIQATPLAEKHLAEALSVNLKLYFEVFGDRAYDDKGQLLSRQDPRALLPHTAILEQVEQICSDASITTINGKHIHLPADSICVHGDNPVAIDAIAAVKAVVQRYDRGA